MPFVTAPDFFAAGLGVAEIDWELDRPAQINRSGLTGGRASAADPWHGKWRARVKLWTVAGEAAFAPVRSFLVRCCATAHSFELPAVVRAQNANSGVTVGQAAAAGATSMALSGAATPLLDGQLAAVNGELLQLVADQSGPTITFEPPLRQPAAAGTAVETARPCATVRLSGREVGWGVDPPEQFSAAFDVEEAF